jgi:hypothetical protein
VKLLRALLVAAAALVVSAAVALASNTPAASVDGLTTASDASGRTVPADVALPSHVPDVTANAHAAVGGTLETQSAEGTAVDCSASVDEEGATDDGVASSTHGDAVCTAAQGNTPDGYDSHGAYVSQVARDNAGADARSSTGADASAAGAANGAAHANEHASADAADAATNASAGLDVAVGAGVDVHLGRP